MTPDERARAYFEQIRWGSSPACPRCGNRRRITARAGGRAGFYVCRACRGARSDEFSVRTGTALDRSRVPPGQWLNALRSISAARAWPASVALAREIGVTQSTAWSMLKRVREAVGDDLVSALGSGVASRRLDRLARRVFVPGR